MTLLTTKIIKTIIFLYNIYVKSKRLFIFIILMAFFVILANVLIVNAFWLALNAPTNKNSQNQVEIGEGKKVTTKITLSSVEDFKNKILVPKNDSLKGLEYDTPKEIVDEITFKKKVVWSEENTPNVLGSVKKILKVSSRFYLRNVPQNPSIQLGSIYRLFKFEILNNNQEITLNDPNGVNLDFKFSYKVVNASQDFMTAKKLYNMLYLNDIVFELTFEVLV